jgi:hypothetical protein
MEEQRQSSRFRVDGAALFGELDIGALAELARRGGV